MSKKTPKVVFACKFNFALNHSDRKIFYNERAAKNNIGGMFNYFSNVKKRAINMFDYFEGKINKSERANLILENGQYATEEDIDKRKKEYLEYFKKSNLWLGVISFDNNYVDSSIELKELEKKIAREVMPKFLKRCGFKDINKMSYQIALHTNTKNYHFHVSFIEKEPNYICNDGTIKYRRIGQLTNEERNFMKNEIIHTIERHKMFTPLVVDSNKQIEELKKYFKPTERNYVLRNYNDLVLEENLLKLGKLLNDKRKGKEGRIKYNSIYDKEIKDLTKGIKDYLFKNKKSELYKQEESFKISLNRINEYFYSINRDNNIKNRKFKSDYSEKKQEYIDNYVYNAIVNHASFIYSKTKKNSHHIKDTDIIEEAVLKMYKNNKQKNSKFNILLNYLSNTSSKNQFKNKYKIEQSIKNINSEMEEAVSEFSKLFKENDYQKND